MKTKLSGSILFLMLSLAFGGCLKAALPQTNEQLPKSVALTEWVLDPIRGDWEVVTDPEFQLINRDDVHTTTNAYTQVDQQGKKLIYEWTIEFIEGTGEESAGVYLMAAKSRPSAGQGQGGDSYLVLQRRTRLELFKYIDGQEKSVHNQNLLGGPVEFGERNTYRVEIHPESGLIEVYRNGTFLGNWNDPSPLQSGAYVAARTTRLHAVFSDIRLTIVE